MKGKICVEYDGIKVGDIVKYRGMKGYVAVIENNSYSQQYLLRLEHDQIEIGQKKEYWGRSWFPEKEKWGADKSICYWAYKSGFKVLPKRAVLESEFAEWLENHDITFYIKPKFKVGDKVKIRKDSEYFGEDGQIKGIGTIIKIKDWGFPFMVKDDTNQNLYNESDLELVKTKPEQKDIIVHCPTEELYDKVMEKIKDGKEFEFHCDWKIEKEKSCICSLEEDNYNIACGDRNYFRRNYSSIPIISAEEYLGEGKVFGFPYKIATAGMPYEGGGAGRGDVCMTETQIDKVIDSIVHDNINQMLERGVYHCHYSTQKVNKPKNKFMKCALDVVKKLRLSADEKLLIEYGCIDEDKRWLGQGQDAIGELEANERGFKSMDGMIQKYGFERGKASIFEFDTHVAKHLPTLIENLKKDKAEQKKN